MSISKPSLITLSIILLFLQSCKNEKNTTNTTSTSTTSENIEIDEKQDYINKYNAYIAVWNKVTPSVEKAYNSLSANINDETGVPLKEKNTYYIASVPETTTMDYLERVLNEDPNIKELDALAPNLIASYKAFRIPLQQFADYYKLQSYLDDDFAKSKELYTLIKPEIERFLAASDALGPVLQKIDNQLSTEALAKYKENDQMLLYHKGMIINSIKRHSAPLYNIQFDEYDKLNLNAYDENLKEVVKHYTAFKELANDKERLKKEMNISRPSPFVIYYMNIEKYIKASRELRALTKDAKEYNSMKKKVETMGIRFASASHEKVIKASETVINTSNTLN